MENIVIVNKKSTIQKEISFSGVGVHSGKEVTCRLIPSEEGRIVFYRTDLNGDSLLIVDPKKVFAENSTTLIEGDRKIRTIEHLMAVLFVFGIDSLIIHMNGEEIPIMDGSAMPFARAIQKAGIQHFTGEKKVITVCKPFVIREGDAFISGDPDSCLQITYSIEYDHPAIMHQKLNFRVSSDKFIEEIAPARTFGFLKDVPALREKGLALGGSLENAIVLDEKGAVNGPLRFADEFVRHKILDFLGDISLVGFPVAGHFKAHRAGHRLHLKTVRFILDNPEYWVFSHDPEHL